MYQHQMLREPGVTQVTVASWPVELRVEIISPKPTYRNHAPPRGQPGATASILSLVQQTVDRQIRCGQSSCNAPTNMVDIQGLAVDPEAFRVEGHCCGIRIPALKALNDQGLE